MAPKKKPATFTFRIDEKARLSLEKGAEAMGLGLTAYVRYLLHTHPGRKK